MPTPFPSLPGDVAPQPMLGMPPQTSQVAPTAGNPIEKVKNWLTNDPKNLALGLIFAASLTQPRSGGRSSFQTAIQRGVGTGLLSGEMTRNQVAQDQLAEKLQLEQQRELNDQAQAEATQAFQRDSLAQQGELARGQQALTGQIAGGQRASEEADRVNRMAIAKLDARTQAQIAGMREGAKNSPFGPIFEVLLKAEAEQSVLSGKPLDISKVMMNLQGILRGGAGTEGTPPLPGGPTPGVAPPVAPEPVVGKTAAETLALLGAKGASKLAATKEEEAQIQLELSGLKDVKDPEVLQNALNNAGHLMPPAQRRAMQERMKQLRKELPINSGPLAGVNPQMIK